ncbi:hypothetical protein [Marinicellulosiphila megalodicopiae]|uniref:hypothetical protein n=1 Tax=Marinicellulosiphila megalodicopiae TaxID=2724896 RepID=UPI003BAF61D9
MLSRHSSMARHHVSKQTSQHHRRNSFFNKNQGMLPIEVILKEQRDSTNEPDGYIVQSGPPKPH